MPILRLDNFSVMMLKPLNLEVIEGILGLSGASGAGKSLFLRAVADLIEHQGEASLDQHICSKTNPVQWRKWVGYLPAESAWWTDIVADHFSKKDNHYLQQLNLPQESMNWEVSRCSTGEKQRLAIARLLAQQPKALLLDEPTASLDPVSVKAVETLIENYSKSYNAPVIWVSHDQMQLTRLAQRSFRIEHNEIIEVTI